MPTVKAISSNYLLFTIAVKMPDLAKRRNYVLPDWRNYFCVWSQVRCPLQVGETEQNFFFCDFGILDSALGPELAINNCVFCYFFRSYVNWHVSWSRPWWGWGPGQCPRWNDPSNHRSRNSNRSRRGSFYRILYGSSLLVRKGSFINYGHFVQIWPPPPP